MNGYKEIVKLLIAKGADANAEDKNGHTPLSIAIQNGHNEIAELLNGQGAAGPVTEAMDTEALHPYENMSFDELVEQLVILSKEGYQWGSNNNFPAIEKYPQYGDIRQVGQLIYERTGYDGMVKACTVLNQRVLTREGGGQYLAEYGWVGIGGWRP